jgi:hypothetical protein
MLIESEQVGHKQRQGRWQRTTWTHRVWVVGVAAAILVVFFVPLPHVSLFHNLVTPAKVATPTSVAPAAKPQLYRTPAGQFRALFPAKPSVRRVTGFDELLSNLGHRASNAGYVVSSGTWSTSVEVLHLTDRSSTSVVDFLGKQLNFDFVRHGNAWIAPSGVTTASASTVDGIVVVTRTNVYSILVAAPTRKLSGSFISLFAAPGMLDWPTLTSTTKPLPTVDLAATPAGWVPVAYGDVQVSVPADWWVFVHDCMTVGASMPGVIFVNPLHETRTACRGGLGKIPKTTAVLSQASPGEIPTSVPAEIINGLRVYTNPAGLRGSYLVPALGVEITVKGPLGQRVLHTLTWSPRSVVLARKPAPSVPSSWQSVSFDGVAFSVPASWQVTRTSVANTLGPKCSQYGTELSDLGPEVSLSTDTNSTFTFCAPIPPVARGPGNGVDVDKGANSPEAAIRASFSKACLKLHGLTACPATTWPYSILVLRVTIPRSARPVYVAIGLAGNGMVARTILYSLRAVSPSEALGSVTGSFVTVGGPAPGSPSPVPGQVTAKNSAGHKFTVTVGKSGKFMLSLPAGVYRLTGHSPRVLSDGAEMTCFSPQPVRVKSGKETRGVEVICSIS